jgi:hypothetical protein
MPENKSKIASQGLQRDKYRLATAFKGQKLPFSGAKSGFRPINTEVTSY